MRICKASIFDSPARILIDAEVLIDGIYTGIARFCTTLEQVHEFAKQYNCERIEYAEMS